MCLKNGGKEVLAGLRKSEDKGRADLEFAFEGHEEVLQEGDCQGEEDEFGEDVHCCYELPSCELFIFSQSEGCAFRRTGSRGCGIGLLMSSRGGSFHS